MALALVLATKPVALGEEDSMFIGFVFLCTLGTVECTKDNAVQIIQIPGTFTDRVSIGFAGVKCQDAAVAYAKMRYSPSTYRIGVNCELSK